MNARNRFSLLDEILLRDGGLETFFSDEERQAAYYQTMASYYGEVRFPRIAYYLILSQVKGLIDSVPEMAHRLMPPTSADLDFTIDAELASYGRTLNHNAWLKFSSEWRGRCEQRIDENKRIWFEAKHDELQAKMQEYRSRTEMFFEAQSKTSARRERERAQGQFFKQLKTWSFAQDLADFALFKYSKSVVYSLVETSFDPDVILAEFFRRYNHPNLILELIPNIFPVPASAASFVRDRLVNPNELLSNELIFPKLKLETIRGKRVERGTSRAAHFDFFEPPRIFHTVFRGIALRECVGGDPSNLTKCTPLKWASTVITDARCLFVAENDFGRGYIELVPIEFKQRRFYSVTLQSNALTRQINGFPLYSYALNKLDQLISSEYRGLVLSEGGEINEADCHALAHKSPEYLEGVVIGGAHEAICSDSILPKIIQHANFPADAMKHVRNILFDATQAGAGRLRQLYPFENHFFI